MAPWATAAGGSSLTVPSTALRLLGRERRAIGQHLLRVLNTIIWRYDHLPSIDQMARPGLLPHLGRDYGGTGWVGFQRFSGRTPISRRLQEVSKRFQRRI